MNLSKEDIGRRFRNKRGELLEIYIFDVNDLDLPAFVEYIEDDKRYAGYWLSVELKVDNDALSFKCWEE